MSKLLIVLHIIYTTVYIVLCRYAKRCCGITYMALFSRHDCATHMQHLGPCAAPRHQSCILQYLVRKFQGHRLKAIKLEMHCVCNHNYYNQERSCYNMQTTCLHNQTTVMTPVQEDNTKKLNGKDVKRKYWRFLPVEPWHPQCQSIMAKSDLCKHGSFDPLVGLG